MTNEKSLIDRLEDIDPYDDPALANVVMDDAKQEITQLRGNLSLAEEGLANYALEVQRHQQLRLEGSAYIAGLQQENERLRAAFQTIIDFSDSAMSDGDGARDVARAAIHGVAHEPLPVAEPEAWLIHCWKPGTHCVFATVDEEDASWWPTDQWKGVTRVPLVSQGQPTLLHGELPPSEAIAVKSGEGQ